MQLLLQLQGLRQLMLMQWILMQCGIAARGLCLNEMLLLWIQIIGNGLLRVGIIGVVLGICRGRLEIIRLICSSSCHFPALTRYGPGAAYALAQHVAGAQMIHCLAGCVCLLQPLPASCL